MARVGAACGDKDKHMQKITDECKLAAKTYTDAGCADKAAALACYLQCLCSYLRQERPFEPAEDDYLVYTFNRFQACRFGLDGQVVDPTTAEHRPLRDLIAQTIEDVEQHAIELRAARRSAKSACARFSERTASLSFPSSRWTSASSRSTSASSSRSPHSFASPVASEKCVFAVSSFPVARAMAP